MPARRFYQLIDLIKARRSNSSVESWERFQTCAPGESFNFCGAIYETYLPMKGNSLASATSLTGETAAEIELPWGSARGLRRLSSDTLKETNFFDGYVVRFMTLSQDDPTFQIPFVPYVVESVQQGAAGITLTLANPTIMAGAEAQLTSLHLSDQRFPELPRTDGR